MKRFSILALLVVVVVAGVAMADSGSRLTVKPSEMKNGETKTLVDDGNTITLRRDGDAVNIKIEGADKTKEVTISRSGDGVIRIDRDGVREKTLVIGPERRRIVIDGMPFDGEFPALPKRKMENWFVCPKDKTMLRVPEGKEGETYKCPVDGTVMEKKKGRGFGFFFDDELFESHSL
jgi:hypothetical protein